MADERRKPGIELADKPEQAAQRPRMFQVVLHNDDYTTMDFVVEVLESVFLKSPAEAFRIMMDVHRNGRGVCGVYPHEIAETKAGLTQALARERGFPLRASVEEA
ncbi:MAG: clpS [Acidobacteria bacterium]|nr:clpS [Acidobacteriota bacterium]